MDQESGTSRRGLYFEEFEIGLEMKSVGRTVTEANMVESASVTGDWTSFHTDAVYAAQHSIGQRYRMDCLVSPSLLLWRHAQALSRV